MKSRTTKEFWKAFARLPDEVRRLAKKNYRLWRENPNHPSLEFKKVHQSQPIYSVRVGYHHRAVGIREEETMIWFWIGSHAEYDGLLLRLKRM